MSLRVFFAVFACLLGLDLHAVSPHAGSYYGSYRFYNGTTPTGVPYSISQIEFTIEDDGKITNVAGGVTNTFGTIQGTVTDAGAATYTIVGANLVSATVSNGVFTGTVVNPPPLPSHPSTTQTLVATKVYDVVPIWAEATSASSLYPVPAFPSDFYYLSVAASDTTFVALIPAAGNNHAWSTLTSTDGVAWTKHSLDPLAGAPSSPATSPLGYANGRFFFAINGTPLRIYSSTDGVSWTMTDTGLANGYVKSWGSFGGSTVAMLYPLGTNNLRAMTSSDGTAWTLRTLATGATTDPTTLATDGTKAIIGLYGQNGSTSPNLYSGTDFTSTWTSSTFPEAGAYGFGPSAVLYGNGFFVGYGSKKLMIASDGIAWTNSIPGPPTSPDDINSYMPFSGGLFSAGNFYGASNIRGGELLRSVDGNAWFRAVRPAAATPMSYSAANVAISHGTAVASAYLSSSSTSSPKLLHATLEYGSGLTATRPPFLTFEPTDQSKLAGTSFSLAPGFKGNGLPTTYQWFKGNQPLSGKTDLNLFFSGSTVADSGSYTCVATNAAGTASTRATLVTITPLPAPTFSSFPASQNVPEGNNGFAYSLSVSATGTGLTYQWRLNGQPISGKTTATLSLTAVPGSSGSYDCVVTNGGGSISHPPAVITFLPATPPVAAYQPTFLTYDPAATAFLSAGVAGGLSPYAYQWFKDGVLLPDGSGVSGATTTSLVVTPAQAGTFRCQVTASNGTLLGPPTVVSVVTPPAHNFLGQALVKIADHNTLRPDAPALKLGLINTARFRDDTVLFTARATTSNTYLYRWSAGTVTAVASDTVAGLNGAAFTGVGSFYTEPSSGSFFFVGNHTVNTVATNTLYRWAGGTLTALLSKDDPAPDGNGTVSSFGVMAARDDVLFISLGIKLPDNTTENRIYRRGADGVISLVLGAGAALPGSTFGFSFAAGSLSYDGTTLTLPLYDKNTSPALYLRKNDGTITRLYDGATPVPLAGSTFTLPGVADVEGGDIFAASTSYFEAEFSPDGTLRFAKPLGRAVTGCGADSFLSYAGRSLFYRKGDLTLTVVDSAQTVDGFAPSVVNAEAQGNEAAILAFNSTASSLFVVLDKPAAAIPVITYQPVPRVSDSGSTVTFTALASGEGLSWQWLKGEAPLPGATLNTLTLNNIAAADAAAYKAVATNTLGSATSNPATLTLVNAGSHAPAFFLQPADQKFVPGQRVNVGISADQGASSATYLWTRNGAPFSNQGGLSFATATAATAGTYQLTITNAFGSVSSRQVVLSVYDPNPVVAPFLLTAPQLSAGSFSFGTPVLTSGVSYLLQTSPTLTTPAWTTLQTLGGTGATQPVTLTVPANATSGFYRLIQAP